MASVVTNAFVRQFQRPAGLFGVLAGKMMARKNLGRIRWAVQEMAIRQGDRILEIGHGPGVAIEEIFLRAPNVSVVGIDPSAVMHAQAKRRNRARLDKGQLRLENVTAEAFELPENALDLVFAINALIFCDDPAGVVRKAASWLAPGGRMVIVHQVPMSTVAATQLDERENRFRNWFEDSGLRLRRINRLPALPNPVQFLEAAL